MPRHGRNQWKFRTAELQNRAACDLDINAPETRVSRVIVGVVTEWLSYCMWTAGDQASSFSAEWTGVKTIQAVADKTFSSYRITPLFPLEIQHQQ